MKVIYIYIQYKAFSMSQNAYNIIQHNKIKYFTHTPNYNMNAKAENEAYYSQSIGA